LAGPMFGYGDLMSGLFKFLTTIATKDEVAPLIPSSPSRRIIAGNPGRHSKSLRPAGAAGRLLIYLVTRGSKTRFCGEPVEERSVGTQLCPYCATHAAMAYTRVGHQSINQAESRKGRFAAAAILLISLPSPLAAQSAEDHARDARIDAILATPNLATPVPQSNLIATAPGLEQQAPSAQFSFNFLAPFIYNSDAEEIGTGGTPTMELSPVGNLSFAAPLFDLPVRLTANMLSKTTDSSNPAAPISTRPVVLYVCSMSIQTMIRAFTRREDVNLGFQQESQS
jgi:hypothetical protein